MGGEKEVNEVKLYVKSGVGDRMGACPFCQRVFMVLMVKSQEKLLKFKVKFILSKSLFIILYGIWWWVQIPQ